MKKILFLYIFLLAGISFVGCSEDETPGFGSVYGIVTDTKTHEPIHGATVTLSPGNLSTTTGQDGHFEFTELEPGQYKIQVQASGYLTNSRQIQVNAGGKSTGDMAIEAQTAISGIKLSSQVLDFGNDYSELVLSLTNTGTAGTISWSITDINVNWLSVSPLSGETAMGKSSSIKVTIDRNKLTEEQSNTFITLSTVGESTIVMICANESVDPIPTPEMRLSATTLSFGKIATNMSLDVLNVGSGKLSWYLSEINQSWLTATPMIGETTAGSSSRISVSVDRSKLTANSTASIFINSGDKRMEINIFVSVEGDTPIQTPEMRLSTTTLSFGKTVTNMNFDVLNVGSGKLSWYLSEINQSWLTATPMIGETTAGSSSRISVSVDRSKLTANSTASIFVNAGGKQLEVTVSAEFESGGGGVDPTEDYSSATVVQCDSRIKAAIVSCKRSGTSVVFTYTLTNNGLGTVNDFRIYPPSSMSLISGASRSVITDDQGNEYPYPIMTFRNEATTGVNVIGSSGFPAGIASKCTITLKDVPSTVKKITAMIGIFAYPDSQYHLTGNRIYFKNVPVY